MLQDDLPHAGVDEITEMLAIHLGCRPTDLVQKVIIGLEHAQVAIEICHTEIRLFFPDIGLDSRCLH